jgi:hypothetical protein
MHREFDRLLKIETLAGRKRALIPLRDQSRAEALENTKVRVLRKIRRQPANRVGFKAPLFVRPARKLRVRPALSAVGEDADHRDERVRKRWVIHSIFIRKGHDEKSIVRHRSGPEPCRDLCFHPIGDLLEKGRLGFQKRGRLFCRRRMQGTAQDERAKEQDSHGGERTEGAQPGEVRHRLAF